MEKGVGSVAATTEAATTGVPASVPDSLAANADTLHIPAAVNDSFPGSPATEKSPDRPAVSEKTTVQSETEASTKSSIRKIPLTKRRYNYRQQIVLAIGMMAFIAIIMTSAQTWNPK
ncbi:MAG: hypothetical protein JW913_10405 [Chitinispirillaceae bacterium]|nr:hypothetical protein [Chitinispirillaceae bacterium]